MAIESMNKKGKLNYFICDSINIARNIKDKYSFKYTRNLLQDTKILEDQYLKGDKAIFF